MKTLNHLLSGSHQNVPTDHGYAADSNTSLSETTQNQSTTLWSPTIKGIVIGAIAGRFLPVFNSFTGAIAGGVAAKVLQHRHKPKHVHQA